MSPEPTLYPFEVYEAWSLGGSVESAYADLDGKYSIDYLKEAFSGIDADLAAWEATLK